MLCLQGGSSGSDILEGPPVSVECMLEDLDMRIRRLEKWNMVHTVSADSALFGTFLIDVMLVISLNSIISWHISETTLLPPPNRLLVSRKMKHGRPYSERSECL